MKFLRQLGVWNAGTEDPDQEKASAARCGDRKAFDALVRAYERPLRGFVGNRVAPEAVDDVLQETWLAAWAGLTGYGKRARFKAWLFGIALHKCADFHRARGRAPDMIPHQDENAAEHAQKDLYAAADLRETVRTALRTLPETQREVLELYYYAELTLSEIAQVSGRNESTVKYQFYRAHAQVAQQLSPFFSRSAATREQKGSLRK